MENSNIEHIDVSTVVEEVTKIFGKDGKNKLKTLVRNEKVYPDKDKLKDDMEILADKLKFDELLNVEKMYFENVESFNSSHLNGHMMFSEFGTIYSRSNLATVKSIHSIQNDGGVYQYEVQLNSNGPMRIGWATQMCAFTDELGVGETENSYGFDGYRLEKWNMSNACTYGRKWRVGNIIGCTIDLGKKSIEFFNNGESLGVIVEELINKDNLTYFPALTLSDEENVVVNLGERPFKFPILNSKPLITSPIALINYFRRLEKNIYSLIESQINLNKKNTKNNLKHYDKIRINNIIKNILFHQFEHLLKNQFIVDSCFILFLRNLNKRSPEKLIVFLELMWENIPKYRMVSIMNYLIFCLLCDFKCTWRNRFDISHQSEVLKLLTAICRETNTRKEAIVNIFFDKIKFAHFLHIISPSDEMLEKMIPRVYWSIENVELSEDMQNKLIKNFPQDYKKSKSAYNEASEKLKKLLNQLEKLQIIFLKTLLNDNDQTDTIVSSRVLFSRRFQSFTQENMIYWRNDPMLKLPGPVLLSTFFRLSFLLRELLSEELVDVNDLKIHPNIFYLENYNFFGIERIGADMDDDVIEINSVAGFITILTRIIRNTEDRNANIHIADAVMNRILSFDLPTDKIHVFSVLLNNIMFLYHVASHRQLIEYVAFKKRLAELSIDYALVDYELKTTNENKDVLEHTLKDIEKKVCLSSRHIAWLKSLIFVATNEQILEWILMIISHTLKYCSDIEEELFRFVPHFYIDNLLGLAVLLPDYTNITQTFDDIIVGKKWLATLIAEILMKIFNDQRIIHPKSREIITQGITLYLTHPKSIVLLQEVSEKSRLRAIKSIFKPMERKIWIKTNLILMLIWYGSGFAFRYTRPPHLKNKHVSTQGALEEIVFSNMGTVRPPATVLQNDIRKFIAYDKETASNFINNSLNYLNWAFSEFISLFQEIKDINGNNSFIISSEEVNKLKSCGKSFIYTVTLLRVIEMMIHFDRNIIIDQEGSLGRVFQLICQILNRINASSSTFSHILASSLPYMECVHKFTILVATTGVLLSMLEGEINKKVSEENAERPSKISSIPEITDVLISDPNFNLSSLDFIILSENENDEPFSLNFYKTYINKEEFEKVGDMYQHLDWYMKRHKSMASSINEEDLCIICYSNKNSVTLIPCRHQCCKLCINHHILYSRVCFYCKGRIESVVDTNNLSTVIHDFGTEPPPLS
ncbi:E3 ubiquitin-protein ligase RNF123-like isoform X2 [Aphis gossypii]|uniref:E3 ubiquitin-protein ligase RNF123-like isoform X2 n=1 Tax=Aphis gossypii TaxID=80765 RepID=UPI00215929E6|nr:E3 ubiquitin-protein ligase RNF123-like isoform X2 [Aphis gossypii]